MKVEAQNLNAGQPSNVEPSVSHEKGRSIDQMAHEAEEKISESFAKAEDYLKDFDAKGALNDVKRVIHEHPLAAAGVGIGIGFLIGRMLRR